MSSCAGVYEGGGVISAPFSGECGGRYLDTPAVYHQSNYVSQTKNMSHLWRWLWINKPPSSSSPDSIVSLSQLVLETCGVTPDFECCLFPLKPCIKPVLATCGWFDHGLLACIFLLVCIVTTPSFLCKGTHRSTVLMCVFCVLKFKKCDLCRR